MIQRHRGGRFEKVGRLKARMTEMRVRIGSRGIQHQIYGGQHMCTFRIGVKHTSFDLAEEAEGGH